MSDQNLTPWKATNRLHHSQASNLKGQKPLPAIRYKDNSPVSSASSSCHPFNLETSSITKAASKGLAVKQSKCGLENLATSQTSYKYKWIRNAERVLQRTDKSDIDLEHSIPRSSTTMPKLTDNPRARQHMKSILLNKKTSPIIRTSTNDQAPTFFVKNSKCVRQLPPLDLYNCIDEVSFRPACPTPASPPPSP